MDGVTASKLTYTSPKGSGTSHGNGCASQTFVADKSVRWQVLSKNTQTGEVVLMSESSIKTNSNEELKTNGVVAYLYVEQEMHSICAIYGYGKGADTSKSYTYHVGGPKDTLQTGTIQSGARSIKVEDVNQIVGYDPTTVEGYPSQMEGYLVYPTITTESGWTSIASIGPWSYTHYTYNLSDYLDTDSKLYKLLSSRTSFANQCIMTGSAGSNRYALYNVFSISSGKIWTTSVASCDQASKGSGLENAQQLRPIVYLKSTVKTKDKDENGAWIIIDN